jgi:hypothetical protein
MTSSSPQERAAGIAPNPAASPGPAVPRGGAEQAGPPSAPVLGGLATHSSQSPRVPRSAPAGTPDPATAARDLRGVSVAARVRQAPAGAAIAVLAGSKPAGREAYELARRKAQARRPADPQQAPGRPGAPARVAEMMRPCATVLPGGGVCGAAGCEHDIGTRAGLEVRTRCSIATAAGPCGCRAYVPQPETPGGTA